MKLHLGCGSIYLAGYVNADVWGTYVDDIGENPNLTNLQNYYKYPFELDVTKRIRREPIIDVKMDLQEAWPFESNTVDEIIMVCCIEHHSYQEACFIRDEAYRVLKSGGKWIVDFPDLKEDFHLYFDSNPKYFFELVYCNGKNAYSFHRHGYTFDTFKEFLGFGWTALQRDIVKHAYPMIGVEATKI